MKRLRVLSIDGGGMRGLYTARYLSSLAGHYARKREAGPLDIGKGFDLIVGASTGAIISCALAAGIRLGHVADLYRHHGQDVFPDKVPSKLGWDLLCQIVRRPKLVKTGAAALKKALEDMLGDITIGEIWRERRIGLAIPVVEMSRHHAWVFKTPHLCTSKHRDDDYKLVDVCLAATAAPVFRSMAYLKIPNERGHQVFVDGGLWANNPVLVSFVDALQMTCSGDSLEIFCLGTCGRPAGDLIAERDVHRGLPEWRFGAGVVEASVDAQEYAFEHMARLLGRHVDRNCRIVRFPQGSVPASAAQYLDLDDTRTEAMDVLETQAVKDASETLSRTSDRADPDGRLLDSLLTDFPPHQDTPSED